MQDEAYTGVDRYCKKCGKNYKLIKENWIIKHLSNCLNYLCRICKNKDTKRDFHYFEKNIKYFEMLRGAITPYEYVILSRLVRRRHIFDRVRIYEA